MGPEDNKSLGLNLLFKYASKDSALSAMKELAARIGDSFVKISESGTDHDSTVVFKNTRGLEQTLTVNLTHSSAIYAFSIQRFTEL